MLEMHERNLSGLDDIPYNEDMVPLEVGFGISR
jgi:hypothetical protein